MHGDAADREVAARQHGVVRLAQFARARARADAASGRRVEAGRLHRVHRGVYAVGHASAGQGGEMARGGARLRRGRDAQPPQRRGAVGAAARPGGPVDVTVPRRWRASARRRGSACTAHPSLHSAVTCRRSGIPVTTPARTLATCAAVRRRGVLRAARCARPDVPRRLPRSVETDRHPQRARAPLPAPLSPPPPSDAGGERPRRPFTVDFLWRTARLIVETDGFRFHRGRAAFEGDRARDAELESCGATTSLRFTRPAGDRGPIGRAPCAVCRSDLCSATGAASDP